MPLFEFKCKKCEKKFEELVFSSRKEPVECSHCGSKETEKLISTFCAGNGSSKSAGQCNAPSGFG